MSHTVEDFKTVTCEYCEREYSFNIVFVKDGKRICMYCEEENRGNNGI